MRFMQIDPNSKSRILLRKYKEVKCLNLACFTSDPTFIYFRLERQDSENIPPVRDRDPETRSRGEGDGRGSEKLERRSECRKEPLTKLNGTGTPSDRLSDLEPPRHFPEGERPPHPNGWGFIPSPGRPASTAFPEGNGQRRGNMPRTHPEKVAQRQNSMSQLQQWVNLRRAAAPTEEMQR